ncbi:lactosylceramide 4-alpha-galactosyltransferase-like [Convolutriloba macropyga]|uniref:lactosylceramide 4-alpha-galactosyltransferase-like n=1 Tax=Convolutriloba macropyga TaxID=536237 RepID=UPI003F51B774
MNIFRVRRVCFLNIIVISLILLYLSSFRFWGQSSNDEKYENIKPLYNQKKHNLKIGDQKEKTQPEKKLPENKKIFCNSSVNLETFSEQYSDKNHQIFFIETHGKPTYRGRQLCTIESALRISNLKVKVVTLSPVLDTTNPILCRLIQEFYPEKLQFYTAQLGPLFVNLPLQDILPRLDPNPKRQDFTQTHVSDFMRYALLYRYGGFNLDLDVLVLKDLTGFKNSIGMEGYTIPNENCEMQTKGQKQYSRMLNGGTMHFESGSPVIWEAMLEANRTYKHGIRWIDMGPVVMNRVASTTFLKSPQGASHNYESEVLTILPSFKFQAILTFIGMPDVFHLNVDPSYFENYFRCTSLVHLSGSASKTNRISGNPRHDIYSYFGPKICPISISTMKNF